MKKNSRSQSPEKADSPELAVRALSYMRVLDRFEHEPNVAVDEDFQQRCREAAETGRQILLLRKAHQKVGFTPCSLTAYLRQLAERAAVDLGKLLPFPLLEPKLLVESKQPGALSPLVALVRRIGMSLPETQTMLRIGVLEYFQAETSLADIRHRKSGRRGGQLQEWGRTVERLESSLTGDQRQQARMIVAQFSASYADFESGPTTQEQTS